MTSELKYFTDASYSPQTTLGVIAIKKVFNNVETDYIHVYKGLKNSELEKVGIKLCVYNRNTEHADTYANVFTDCESSIHNLNFPNVSLNWIKGHMPKKTELVKMINILEK